MARPPKPAYEPTDEHRELVETMAVAGISELQMALVVGAEVKTLRLHYSTEIDTAGIRANINVAAALYAAAIAGDTGAAQFWLKTRMGWGSGGGAIVERPAVPDQPHDEQPMSLEDLMANLSSTRLT